jgi:hypothetical protein
MLEYLAVKKFKKHKAERLAKEEVPAPVLSRDDEHFLERIVSAEGTPPPLPERPSSAISAVSETGDSTQDVVHGEGTEAGDAQGRAEKNSRGKGREDECVSDKGKKKSNIFSFLHRSTERKGDLRKENITRQEGSTEEDDIHRILDELNLAAVNNHAISLSKESQIIVQKFTVILKDLVNGVPTAYDDLVSLLDDSHGTLAKSYEHLPSFLQKLITSLPQKLTTTFAPELLAVAAEAQGLNATDTAKPATAASGLAGAAKKYLKPTNLKDLVTKPSAVVGILKSIMKVLESRFPALMGTNVLLSVSLFSKMSRHIECNLC